MKLEKLQEKDFVGAKFGVALYPDEDAEMAEGLLRDTREAGELESILKNVVWLVCEEDDDADGRVEVNDPDHALLRLDTEEEAKDLCSMLFDMDDSYLDRLGVICVTPYFM